MWLVVARQRNNDDPGSITRVKWQRMFDDTGTNLGPIAIVHAEELRNALRSGDRVWMATPGSDPARPGFPIFRTNLGGHEDFQIVGATLSALPQFD